MTPEMFSDSLSRISDREKELVEALKAMLGIYANVQLVAPKTITRSEGKAVRIVDKRKSASYTHLLSAPSGAGQFFYFTRSQ